MHNKVRGAYACVAMIIGHGLVAFRDPFGIRPLVLGKRTLEDGQNEYMVASESVALDTLGFEFCVMWHQGKQFILLNRGNFFPSMCRKSTANPCLFEFVYLARPDSFIDKISVNKARLRMGQSWAPKLPASGRIWILML